MQVVLTPRAEGQLDRLHRYIRTVAANDGPTDTLPVSSISAPDLRRSHYGDRLRNDLLEGLRTIGFERRVTIAFIFTADAVLIEGVFYGGQDFEAVFLGDA